MITEFTQSLEGRMQRWTRSSFLVAQALVPPSEIDDTEPTDSKCVWPPMQPDESVRVRRVSSSGHAVTLSPRNKLRELLLCNHLFLAKNTRQ